MRRAEDESSYRDKLNSLILCSGRMMNQWLVSFPAEAFQHFQGFSFDAKQRAAGADVILALLGLGYLSWHPV